jgi:hypothetical protein
MMNGLVKLLVILHCVQDDRKEGGHRGPPLQEKTGTIYRAPTKSRRTWQAMSLQDAPLCPPVNGGREEQIPAGLRKTLTTARRQKKKRKGMNGAEKLFSILHLVQDGRDDSLKSIGEYAGDFHS